DAIGRATSQGSIPTTPGRPEIPEPRAGGPRRPPGARARIGPKETDMTSRMRLHFLLAMALGVSLLVLGCGQSSTEELVVGEYGSLTGGDADFGQSTKRGVALALDELTAGKQGKIGGMPVRVVVEDDEGKAEEAATVVQKLVNQDRVIAVVGEVASGRSLAGGPICQN